MDSKLFIIKIVELFNEWLNAINEFINNGKITISGEYSFNHVLRVAESSTHYICELCGSKKYKSNEIISIEKPKKPEKITGNTTSYFWSKAKNNENALIKINCKGSSLGGLSFKLITSTEDYNSIINKIKLPIQQTGLLGTSNKLRIPIYITSDSDYILLNNIELLETDGICIYYRIIPTAIIIKKPVDEIELETQLNKFLLNSFQFFYQIGSLIGLNTNLNSSVEYFANELFSLSTQNVKETVIDKFIQNHANFFVKALGYKNALSQKTLKWIEREKNDPQKSKPDFLMERDDGYYDILDLKTGAIKYKAITKSKKNRNNIKSRIRFIDYVNDLIIIG